jgi:DNA-binding Lrp family transcriptional regulator
LPRTSIKFSESAELDKQLASYLLSLKLQDPILSIRELAEFFGTSTGSISNTVNKLEEMGAVRISRRGRLGSFLEEKSLGILWTFIHEGPMVIALTMPSFPKCEGLATAIYCMLNDAGVETYLIFIRGSYNRLKALRDGMCDAVIISSLAADELCSRREKIILRLPPESFVTDHRVFFQKSSKSNSQPLRVGIDVDSFDIKYLTELEFPEEEVDYEKITLMQIGRHLLEGFVDAAIWNIDHMTPIINDDIDSRPLSPEVRDLIGDRHTSAAMVIRTKSKSARTVLEEVLGPDSILAVQQRVTSGEMVPRY